MCRWKPREKRKGTGPAAPPTRPDQLWQTDIRCTKVVERNDYLLSFLDAYSRYVVHHELLTTMDGWSVSIAAAAAIETLAQVEQFEALSGLGDRAKAIGVQKS